jgi:hypothetical protein
VILYFIKTLPERLQPVAAVEDRCRNGVVAREMQKKIIPGESNLKKDINPEFVKCCIITRIIFTKIEGAF